MCENEVGKGENELEEGANEVGGGTVKGRSGDGAGEGSVKLEFKGDNSWGGCC